MVDTTYRKAEKKEQTKISHFTRISRKREEFREKTFL